MITHLALPYWLQEAVTADTLLSLQDSSGPLFSLLMVIIVGSTVHSFRESLDLPTAPARVTPKAKVKLNLFGRPKVRRQVVKNKSGVIAPQAVSPEIDRTHRPVRVPHQNELPEWEPPRDESGLIMLEID